MLNVKFRGKRKSGNEWLIGDLCHSDLDVFIFPPKDAPLNSTSWFEVETSSIGMFTGLTDKNGKEIYGAVGEKGGDVVKFTANWGDYMGHIEYGIIGEDGEKHAAFGYYVIRGGVKESFYLSLMDINATGTEIIGNATDNPELLNQ